MKKPIKDVSFVLLLLLLSILSIIQTLTAIDTIDKTQTLKDGDTLVSSEGTFELGFFSPGNSDNRYVGIWYKKVSIITPVWVLNRETPLNNIRGIIKFNEFNHLVLVNETGNLVWSSNTSRTAQKPILQLLDSGNLVLREANDDNPDNFIWQSFDHLSDTSLPGVNFGVDNYLSSWTSNDDPAPGEFTFSLDPTGYAQFFTKRGEVTTSRLGPWNGFSFSGGQSLSLPFRNGLFRNKNTTYYREDSTDKSVISRTTLNQSGDFQRWIWVGETRGWVLYLSLPLDNCDTYKLCGAYGTCYIGNSPACACLDKFVPKDQEGWTQGDWSSGCIRNTPLNCTEGDIFLKYSSVKLPNSRNSTFNNNMTLEECNAKCLEDCSCTAYTQLDIVRGSGCLLWFGDLIDIRDLAERGRDIYVRMALSELDSFSDSKGRRRKILISSLTSLTGVVLLGLSLMLYYWKRKKDNANRRKIATESQDFELPLFELSTVSKATNNFSFINKLGQGGYGPVYKGVLENGQDIAVKRLSKTSTQGIVEFKNEVICIAKLQHRNLVKLLGCCIQGDEKMLIYEYMPNKSLDLILFDQTKSKLFDWPKRLQVVNGVARGLMYIHQDSQLRIIHRDLKASNILLDTDMKPKISDFGIARSYRGNETEDKTSKVVGTYGYMSPEYAVHGRFSIKSDVFSFGVLVLEVVSSKKNSGFSSEDRRLNLLGHAWKLYKEERSLELVDPCLYDSAKPSEVLRLIHVGLLCVQQSPRDRPSMASVVAMLDNEVMLPPAKQPGFFTETDVFAGKSATSCSSNEATITQLEAR